MNENVPALVDLDLSHVSFLQNIEERDTIGVPKEQHAGAGVEDLVAVGNHHFLGQLVLEVLDAGREWVLFITANLFLATQIAVHPEDRFPS